MKKKIVMVVCVILLLVLTASSLSAAQDAQGAPKFYELPRIEDNSASGPDGSYINVSLDRSPVAALSEAPGFSQENLHNADGTFYPGDAFSILTTGNNPHNYYDKIQFESGIFQTDELSIPAGLQYNAKQNIIIDNNASPGLYRVKATLLPALAELKINIFGPGGLGLGLDWNKAQVFVDNEEWGLSYPGSVTRNVEQGTYTITFGAVPPSPGENSGGGSAWIMPSPLVIALEPGQSYLVEAYYGLGSSPPYTQHNAVNPSSFVKIQSISTEIDVCVVQYAPQFTVISYLMTGENGVPPNNSFECPQAILVRYDGNAYDPENSELLSLQQRAVVSGLEWQALGEKPKLAPEREPQIADDGSVRHYENGDVIYYEAGDVEFNDNLQPKMEQVDLMVPASDYSPNIRPAFDYPSWGQLVPLDVVSGPLGDSSADQYARTMGGEETISPTWKQGSWTWKYTAANLENLIEVPRFVGGQFNNFPSAAVVTVTTNPPGISVTVTVKTPGPYQGTWTKETPFTFIGATAENQVVDPDTGFPVKPFLDYTINFPALGYLSPPPAAGLPITQSGWDFYEHLVYAGTYEDYFGQTWHREYRGGAVHFDGDNRYYKFVLQPNQEIMQSLFAENFSSVTFNLKFLDSTPRIFWSSGKWSDPSQPIERVAFSTTVAWEPLGFEQPVAFQACKLLPEIHDRVYSASNPEPGLVLNENSWTVDWGTSLQLGFAPLAKVREALENLGEDENLLTALAEANPSLSSLAKLDNYMLDEIARDTGAENEPDWQYVTGAGLAENTVYRYGTDLFLLSATAQGSGDNGTFDDIVQVPFNSKSTLNYYANLSGDGLAAEVVDNGAGSFQVRVYAPVYAGGLGQVKVLDNENRTLFFSRPGMMASELEDITGLMALTGADLAKWSGIGQVVAGQSGTGVYEYTLPRPVENTTVTVEITNTWGATIAQGPFFVEGHQPQLGFDITRVILLGFFVVLVGLLADWILVRLRGRKIVRYAEIRAWGRLAESTLTRITKAQLNHKNCEYFYGFAHPHF